MKAPPPKEATITPLLNPQDFLNKTSKEIEALAGPAVHEDNYLTLDSDKPEKFRHYQISGIKTFQVDFVKDRSVGLWIELPYESWSSDIGSVIRLCGLDLNPQDAKIESAGYWWTKPTAGGYASVHIKTFMDSKKFYNCLIKSS